MRGSGSLWRWLLRAGLSLSVLITLATVFVLSPMFDASKLSSSPSSSSSSTAGGTEFSTAISRGESGRSSGGSRIAGTDYGGGGGGGDDYILLRRSDFDRDQHVEGHHHGNGNDDNTILKKQPAADAVSSSSTTTSSSSMLNLIFCNVTFVRYRPSRFEASWAVDAPQHERRERLCRLLYSDTALSSSAAVVPVAVGDSASGGGGAASSSLMTYRQCVDEYVRWIPRMAPDGGPQQAADASTGPGTTGSSNAGVCDRAVPPAAALRPDVFSTFEHVFRCYGSSSGVQQSNPTTATTSIVFETRVEPLVGLLRDPRVCARPYSDKQHLKAHIQRKEWLLLDPVGLPPSSGYYRQKDIEALTTSQSSSSSLSTSSAAGPSSNPAAWLLRSRLVVAAAPSRRFLFDLGASTWGAGGGGPSQSWFYNTYRRYCATFTEIYAWEAMPVDAGKFFAEVPGPLRPGYHYFNHPLTAERGHWDNPLTHILQRTHPDDFVVLKVDFDAPLIEMGLIEQILAPTAEGRAIAARIDEMFFEHHVNVEIMKYSWQTKKLNVTHSDSLAVFAALRRRGIRAHSWV